jgi:hypothetical protein
VEIFLYDKATMSYCGCKIAQYFVFSFIIDHQKNPNFDRQYLSNPWSDFDKNYTKFLLLISSSNILVMKQHQNIFFLRCCPKKIPTKICQNRSTQLCWFSQASKGYQFRKVQMGGNFCRSSPPVMNSNMQKLPVCCVRDCW